MATKNAEKQKLILREIDKLDKIGKDKVRESISPNGTLKRWR